MSERKRIYLCHHRHVQGLYEQLLADVKGVTVHKQPDVRCKMADGREIHVYDSNYWLCTITIDENVKGNHPNEAAPPPRLQNRTPIESGFVF